MSFLGEPQQFCPCKWSILSYCHSVSAPFSLSRTYTVSISQGQLSSNHGSSLAAWRGWLDGMDTIAALQRSLKYHSFLLAHGVPPTHPLCTKYHYHLKAATAYQAPAMSRTPFLHFMAEDIKVQTSGSILQSHGPADLIPVSTL